MRHYQGYKHLVLLWERREENGREKGMGLMEFDGWFFNICGNIFYWWNILCVYIYLDL